MRKILLALLAVPLVSSAAHAQAVCKDRGEIIKILASKYNEHQRAYGIQQNGSVMEIYANLETGSWTVLITMPAQSCVVASGQAWEELPPMPVGDPA